MSFELQPITDHIDIARNRVISQFKDKSNFDDLLNVFMQEIQELEGVFIALLLERGLDTAVGTQLDILGAHVGASRNGLSDVDYRAKIHLQISINTSDGTEGVVAEILKSITNATNVSVTDSTFDAWVSLWTDGDTFGPEVLATVDKVLGASIKFDLRVSAGATPFVMEGDTQGEGFGSVHASGGGAMVDQIVV